MFPSVKSNNLFRYSLENSNYMQTKSVMTLSDKTHQRKVHVEGVVQLHGVFTRDCRFRHSGYTDFDRTQNSLSFNIKAVRST